MTHLDALFDGRSFAAMLFDMDGTLLSSIAAAERVWTRWAAQFGIDAKTFLPDIHGRRAVDSVRRLNIPGVDAEAEAAAITLAEIEDVDGVRAIPGAREFEIFRAASPIPRAINWPHGVSAAPPMIVSSSKTRARAFALARRRERQSW